MMPKAVIHDRSSINSSSSPPAAAADDDINDNDSKKNRGVGIVVSGTGGGAGGESSLPLWQSVTLAGVYMFGCISFFLLIRYSKVLQKRGEIEDYDNAAAVFCTELLKWIFSVGMVWHRQQKFLPFSVWKDPNTWRTGLYYAVPSGIYAVYNNLTYSNLTLFDPATYQVFMQTRILFTGVLYSYLLSKHLSSRKWCALTLLTLGVASKYFSFNLQIDWRISFMLFQASLSAFAGVYNEYLLKRDITMDVNEQNFFMYSFALVFNLGFGLFSHPSYYLSGELFTKINPILVIIVINGAVVGIVTSLILKFINVIVKAFASACEVLLTAVFAAWLLGDTLSYKDFVACVIVTGSIYIYYSLPSTTTTPTPTTALSANSTVVSGAESSSSSSPKVAVTAADTTSGGISSGVETTSGSLLVAGVSRESGSSELQHLHHHHHHHDKANA